MSSLENQPFEETEVKFPEEVGKPYVLHYMASKGNVEIFKQILAEIAKEKEDNLFETWFGEGVLPEPYLSLINWKDKTNNGPLHWATHGKKFEIAGEMVKWGANPQASNHADMTPIEQAWHGGQIGLDLTINWIQSQKINPAFQTEKGSWFHRLLLGHPYEDEKTLQLLKEFSQVGVDIDALNALGEKADDETFLDRCQIQGSLREQICIHMTQLHLNNVPHAQKNKSTFRL